MKFLQNPFFLGFAILISEVLINTFIGAVFGSESGDNNIFAIILFMWAGMWVVYQAGQKMSNWFILKVLATYYSVLLLIMFGSLLGEEITKLHFIVVFALMSLFVFLSFLFFKLGQIVGMTMVERKRAKTFDQEKITEIDYEQK